MCLNHFAHGEWTQEINSELINAYYLKIDENLHTSSKDWNSQFWSAYVGCASYKEVIKSLVMKELKQHTDIPHSTQAYYLQLTTSEEAFGGRGGNRQQLVCIGLHFL